jgi:hypothetical protein
MVIRRVGVWSIARIAAALYTVIGLVAGFLFAGISLVSAGFAQAVESGDELPAWLAPLFGVGAIVIFPILYGVMGLIVGAVGALVYNLAAGAVGGIEIEIQQ